MVGAVPRASVPWRKLRGTPAKPMILALGSVSRTAGAVARSKAAYISGVKPALSIVGSFQSSQAVTRPLYALDDLADEGAPFFHLVGRALNARQGPGPSPFVLRIVPEQDRHRPQARCLHHTKLAVVFGPVELAAFLFGHAPAPPGADPLDAALGENFHAVLEVRGRLGAPCGYSCQRRNSRHRRRLSR